MLNLISRVARSDTTVMITGETGVGKDLVAQAIHYNSSRSSVPFISVNVVSLSPELIASGLFGHEKGAFTGATQRRGGRFELAGRGTLFLDDIPALALYFPEMFAKKFGKHFDRISRKDREQLMSYHMPGNIRELRHVIERAVLLSTGDHLVIPPLDTLQPDQRENEDRIVSLKEMEARHIVRALSRCRGKVNGPVGAVDCYTFRADQACGTAGDTRQYRS